DHREARPCERPVPAEEPRLELRPEKPRAHAEAEPCREREDAEGDEPGCAGDEPRDGEGGCRAHDATSRAHAGRPAGRLPAMNGAPAAGTTSAEMCGRAAT